MRRGPPGRRLLRAAPRRGDRARRGVGHPALPRPGADRLRRADRHERHRRGARPAQAAQPRGDRPHHGAARGWPPSSARRCSRPPSESPRRRTAAAAGSRRGRSPRRRPRRASRSIPTNTSRADEQARGRDPRELEAVALDEGQGRAARPTHAIAAGAQRDGRVAPERASSSSASVDVPGRRAGALPGRLAARSRRARCDLRSWCRRRAAAHDAAPCGVAATRARDRGVQRRLRGPGGRLPRSSPALGAAASRCPAAPRGAPGPGTGRRAPGWRAGRRRVGCGGRRRGRRGAAAGGVDGGGRSGGPSAGAWRGGGSGAGEQHDAPPGRRRTSAGAGAPRGSGPSGRCITRARLPNDRCTNRLRIHRRRRRASRPRRARLQYRGALRTFTSITLDRGRARPRRLQVARRAGR